MPTYTATNRGVNYLATNDMSAADIRQGVITDAVVPTQAAIRDMNFVADLLTSGSGPATEAAAAGYARQDLGAVTVTEDDTGDVNTITTVDATYTTPAIGEDWAAVFYFVQVTNDADSVLLGVGVADTPIPTNGQDVTGAGFDWTVGQDDVIGT